MTNHHDQSLETILAKYRPAEAPADLLCRVEQAARRRRRAWHGPFAPALSAASEIVLGVIVRGLVTATTVIVLLLLSAGGH